jgi:hypothetical protein
LLDILLDNGDRGSPAGAREITWGPEDAFPVGPVQFRMLFSQKPGGNSFETIDQLRDSDLRRVIDKQMHMVVFAVEVNEVGVKVPADVHENPSQIESSIFFVNTVSRYFVTKTKCTCRTKTQCLPVLISLVFLTYQG